MSDNFNTNGGFWATRAVLRNFVFGLFLPACLMGYFAWHDMILSPFGVLFVILGVVAFMFSRWVLKKAREGDSNTMGWGLMCGFIFILGFVLGANAH